MWDVSIIPDVLMLDLHCRGYNFGCSEHISLKNWENKLQSLVCISFLLWVNSESSEGLVRSDCTVVTEGIWLERCNILDWRVFRSLLASLQTRKWLNVGFGVWQNWQVVCSLVVCICAASLSVVSASFEFSSIHDMGWRGIFYCVLILSRVDLFLIS